MILEPNQLLFCLNRDFCDNKCYGLVANNVFDIFSYKSDWSLSLKCQVTNNYKSRFTLFFLTGADLGLHLFPGGMLILKSKDAYNSRASMTAKSLSKLKENTAESYLFTINYNFELNSYYVYFDGEEVMQKKLSTRKHEFSKFIYLFNIGRQCVILDDKDNTSQIRLENAIFTNKIFEYQKICSLLKQDPNLFTEDEFERMILKDQYKDGIVSYYNFHNNLDGKVWDLTGNNNFLFTKLLDNLSDNPVF